MLELNSRVTALVLVSATSALLAGVIMASWWNKRKTKIPEKWLKVGEVAEVFMYPLKSGCPLPIAEVECTDFGCQTDKPLKMQDRNFVIVSEKGTTKTARQHPKMLKIKMVKSDANSVTFDAPGMSHLSVTIPKDLSSKKLNFTMWEGETLEFVDCGDAASQWFHSYLGLKEDDKIRLGYFLEQCVLRRDLKLKGWNRFMKVYPNLQRYDSGKFSDMASYQLINEASVAELKRRMEKGSDVTPVWFRPNFIIRGAEPFAEDNWNFIKIGESSVFQYGKPCTRCVLTTINPETCVKDPDMEPLRTLRTFRTLQDPKQHALEKSPAMGIYLGLRHPGVVKVGDPVYVGLEES